MGAGCGFGVHKRGLGTGWCQYPSPFFGEVFRLCGVFAGWAGAIFAGATAAHAVVAIAALTGVVVARWAGAISAFAGCANTIGAAIALASVTFVVVAVVFPVGVAVVNVVDVVVVDNCFVAAVRSVSVVVWFCCVVSHC